MTTPPSTHPHRRRSLYPSLLSVAVCAAVLTGCGQTATDQDHSASASCVDTSSDTIKVGSLNSLSGTMSISEVTVRDATKLAVDEINSRGGVLGKKIDLVGEDGASDPAVFAQKADKLIREDCVAAIFGAWTSPSRKAMLGTLEDNNSLLYYPVQYEGLETSKNVFYTGATANQQIVPALDYLKDEKKISTLYIVGSDSVFSRTAGRIVRAYAQAHGIDIKGEDYVQFGSTDFSTVVSKIRQSNANAVFNTINGDSNVAFFREVKNTNLTPAQMPIMSVSIGEEEVAGIGADNVAGELTAWDYYQTLDNPRNAAFVAAYKSRFGASKPTSDPMEAAYVAVYLWKNTVEKAKSFATDDVRKASGGVTFDAPEGLVTIDGENQHVYKTARIGEIGPDGLIRTIWDSGKPIQPDPYLTSYPWAKGLSS
ncbi:urea ABC transporter substrate-binding protein [Mycobacteroides abscessus]|uniref:urea ABC transporter substrate-binding protein n=1 Tax=Mycobacteroides abscessus TaxID=36809 RepID=UPI0009A8D6B9|nr:urea ABC transporter substrate-binding protein [Mycobacteroides abscessus]SLF24406.1 urea ABC transporter, urea binding protein [Mycobacteroides abscessus subsp. abscessus]